MTRQEIKNHFNKCGYKVAVCTNGKVIVKDEKTGQGKVFDSLNAAYRDFLKH